MKCSICNGLGILPGLTKNTKCSYCEWGEIEDEMEELKRKADLYDRFLQEANEQGYSGIGEMIDSCAEWKLIAEKQAEDTLSEQKKISKILDKLQKEEYYLGDKIHYGINKLDDYRCFHLELYIPQKVNSSKEFKKCLEDWLGISDV